MRACVCWITPQREEWIVTLHGLVERESIHGLVAQRAIPADLGAPDEPEL
jgi:hypothetical protein